MLRAQRDGGGGPPVAHSPVAHQGASSAHTPRTSVWGGEPVTSTPQASHNVRRDTDGSQNVGQNAGQTVGQTMDQNVLSGCGSNHGLKQGSNH